MTAEELKETEWFKTRPKAVQKTALEFPPGTQIVIGATVNWVVGYQENGALLISVVNPGEDYKKAVATRLPLCPSCVTTIDREEARNE